MEEGYGNNGTIWRNISNNLRPGHDGSASDAVRAAGKDDALKAAERLGRRVGREYFGIDAQAPDAVGDQVRILSAEIEYDE